MTHGSRLKRVMPTMAAHPIGIEAALPGLRLPVFLPEPAHPSRGVLGEGAECVYDPELHTGPAGAESPMERAARQEVAREVCATCPLLPRCLAYALAAAPTTGVWAARTAQELTASARGVLAEVA